LWKFFLRCEWACSGCVLGAVLVSVWCFWRWLGCASMLVWVEFHVGMRGVRNVVDVVVVRIVVWGVWLWLSLCASRRGLGS